MLSTQEKNQKEEITKEKESILSRRNIWLSHHKHLIEPLLPPYSKFLQKLNTNTTWSQFDVSKINQPKEIKGTMKPYQIEGLRWLVQMHENGLNGILGDEMGMGKSLQTIAFLWYLKEKIKGQHLIIVPLSVLESWMNEFKKWSDFNVFRFHGPENIRANLRVQVKDFDIVVTTYEMYVAEKVFFKRVKWCYVVLDEGHKIKNDSTIVSHELQSLNSQFRLILTGTPLQNNLVELWSLLQFLYSDVFEHSRQMFLKGFNASTNTFDLKLVESSSKFLDAIMLRRMKLVVDLDIPDKEEITIYVPISPAQRALYKSCLTAEIPSFDSLFSASIENEENKQVNLQDLILKSSSSSNIYQKLKGLLFSLQMTCSHPFLLIKEDVPGVTDNISQAVSCCSKMILLDKLLPSLKANGHRVLIFAQYIQVLDILEEYIETKGWECARLDGSVGRARRQLDMKLFNDENSKITRAGGLGITLTAADTVIFYDSDWNPQVDMQAMARAHRIGQTKKVTVYRLCVRDTVEERLLTHAKRKLWLSTKVIEERNSEVGEQMNANQLLSTIKFGASCVFKASNDFNEFVNEDVEVLLDRSKNHQNTDTNEVDVDEKNEGLRVFEGLEHKKQKEKSWADRWSEEVSGKKRRRIERTIAINGHSVLAETIHSDEAVPSIITLLKVAGQEFKYKDIYDLRVKSTQLQHEGSCHVCHSNEDELFECRSCPRAYHYKCIGIRKKDAVRGFVCFKHKCVECNGTASAVGGLILRCRSCTNSYCYDHCPDGVVYIGESIDELVELGYEVSKQFYYVYCVECQGNGNMDAFESGGKGKKK